MKSLNPPIFTIDSGNTNTTVGHFHQNHLLNLSDINHSSELKTFKQKIDSWPESTIVYSTVSQLKLLESFSTKKNILDISSLRKSKSFLKMPVHYSTTLGSDRLAISYLGFKEMGHTNLLIIDAGTFITSDYINHKGFAGGIIIPGVKKMISNYKEGFLLKNHISFKQNLSSRYLEKIPQNTADSISSGIVHLFYSFFDHQIITHNPKHIWITGGDSTFIQTIFSDLKEKNPHLQIDLKSNLIHYALYDIYREYLGSKL